MIGTCKFKCIHLSFGDHLHPEPTKLPVSGALDCCARSNKFVTWLRYIFLGDKLIEDIAATKMCLTPCLTTSFVNVVSYQLAF